MLSILRKINFKIVGKLYTISMIIPKFNLLRKMVVR